MADVMGLGKTLTMLSAVVHSKKVASEFAKSDSVAVTENLTRATLIVVTSRRKSLQVPSSHFDLEG